VGSSCLLGEAYRCVHRMYALETSVYVSVDYR
jgi:hypothetical protein